MPRARLSQEDQDILSKLREGGVLREIQPAMMPKHTGTIHVPCSDGERIRDMLSHHWDTCDGGRNCHHTPALNGGPLLIPLYSPVRRYTRDDIDPQAVELLGPDDLREDRVLLYHARKGCQIKGVGTVVLEGHAPCGMAYTAGLNVLEVLELLFEAKQVVRTFIPNKTVMCKLHVEYHENKLRTYFLNRRTWQEWCDENQTYIAQFAKAA